MKSQVERAWRFVRGDADTLEFRAWALSNRGAGSTVAGLVRAADYSDRDSVFELRFAVAAHLSGAEKPRCACIRLRDTDVVDIEDFTPPMPAFTGIDDWSHDDVFRTLESLGGRDEEHWWLDVALCSACDQHWLIGTDDRHNDVECLHRMTAADVEQIGESGEWPAAFETYEHLLRLARAEGRFTAYDDPLDSPLDELITELATARPGITISELAELLNVDTCTASTLARTAQEKARLNERMSPRLDIEFDG